MINLNTARAGLRSSILSGEKPEEGLLISPEFARETLFIQSGGWLVGLDRGRRMIDWGSW